jgi:putative flippase GtrA
MIIEILKMMGLTILQNASFTLVSRARNSKSLSYHATASILSNGIWLLVIRNVVSNFDKIELMITYLIGSVLGSVGMHYLAMKYFEKHKEKK